MKKCISILLSLAIVMTFSVFTAAPANAATSSDTKTVRGVYWFDTHELGDDLTDTFIYNESLLKIDSAKYNKKLATMSFELAVASISSEREPKTTEGYKKKSRNLKAYLTDNGFVDFETNKYYKQKMTTSTMGAACAHKQIVDDGKTYTLLAIVPRSAGYESEWGGNFVLGESGDHAGFTNGKNIVLGFAKEYIKKHNIKGNIKVWTAGYSRGAGVTNLVGSALIKDPKGALGDNVTLKRSNLYCYTFGTPKAADGTADYSADKYKYIHNSFETYDVVTVAPPARLGFARYGSNHTYAVPANKDRMLSFLKVTNKTVYDLYMNGGDPDKFTPKKLDVNTLITKREIKLVDDTNSYLPSDQREFMKLLDDSLAEMSGSREGYYNTYEKPLEHLCGYYFSHIEQSGDMVSGLTSSKFAIPEVISLYIAFIAERYKDNIIDDETLAQLEDALDELDAAIDAMIDKGIDVPQEVLDKYNELKSEVKKGKRLGALSNISNELSAILYSNMMKDALTEAKADEATIKQLTSMEDSRAISHMLMYLCLYDKDQKEEISFDYLNQQFKHFATLVGNSSSFMRPHNNEIILSWLRARDSNYDDVKKENTAQKTGYRRVYIDSPDGVTVTGTVKNSKGQVVAKFKNDRIVSRSDKWIGITMCDTGSWLRLPLNKKYRVEIKVNKDAKLKLKVAEFSVYEGKVVRKVTKDDNYNWRNLSVDKKETVTLYVNAVKKSGSDYKLASNARYYIKKKLTSNKKPILRAKAISKSKTSVRVSWNKIKDADRYVVYFAKCSPERKAKKYKTLGSSKQSLTISSLGKYKAYKVYIEAQKKENGKYVKICRSTKCHFATGDLNQGKYTNAKAVKLKKTDITLSKGSKYTVKAKIIKVKKNKELLPETHSAQLHYRSNDKTVATVSKNGVIKATGKGTCRIYVQAMNGVGKSIKVTVK